MEEYTIKLTREECNELSRTLLGRIDLDIRKLQYTESQAGNYEQVAYLQHIADVNKSILNKIPTKALDLF